MDRDAALRTGASRAQRLRSQALWAFSLAGVCVAAALVGLVQYCHSGAVSIRPGHDPITGAEALESLLALLLLGILLAVGGVAFRSRAAAPR
jgi:hypothetical protein